MAWRSILLVLLIVAGIIWYFENQKDNHLDLTNKNDEALDILKKRYAKGEISLEEFDEKRDVLEDIY